MAKVAVVSGGTRGIGAAISKALQAAGYTAVANYAGNDEAAAKFKAETGIPVYKWDVCELQGLRRGTKQSHTRGRAGRDPRQQRGVTRDTMFHKMTPEQWYEVININLNSLFNMTRPVIEGMRERGFGRIVIFPQSTAKRARSAKRITPRRNPATSALRNRLPRKTRARGSPSTPFAPAISQPTWSRRFRRSFGKIGSAAHSGAPAWRTGGSCALRRVSRRRGVRLHHRLDTDHQRRPIYGVIIVLPDATAGRAEHRQGALIECRPRGKHETSRDRCRQAANLRVKSLAVPSDRLTFFELADGKRN